MSQPAGETAPGAPTPPATPPAPTGSGASATPPAAPPTGQDPNEPIDFDKLPANVTKYIADLRKEAGAHRQGKTAAEQAAEQERQRTAAVLKALGLNPDGTTAPQDPEAAAAQLQQRLTEAESAAWGATVRFEVYQRAAALGGDPAALLDSLSFVDSLDELAAVNPSDPGFVAALEAKIRDAVRDPRLRAKTGPVRQGADITGSGGANTGRPASLREAFARKNT